MNTITKIKYLYNFVGPKIMGTFSKKEIDTFLKLQKQIRKKKLSDYANICYQKIVVKIFFILYFLT